MEKQELRPKVSVIIPVYNHPDWLEEAIDSVLGQTYQNFEIIVIDDGSKDDIKSLNVLESPRIRYYRNSNHGVAYSRNYGIRKAEGKYVAFLDSDDIWLPEKLSKQINAMEKNGALWSQHSYYYFDNDTRDNIKLINTSVYGRDTKWYTYTSFKVQTSCFMIRRNELIDKNIFFDENLEYGEEIKLYRALADEESLLCIEEPLARFRIRGSNAGFDARKQILSRANDYIEYGKTYSYRENTSIFTKIAYWYCGKVSKILKQYKINSGLCKFLYLMPWALFKVGAMVIPNKALRRIL